MSGVDVLQVQALGVRTDTGGLVGLLSGHGPNLTVSGPDDEVLLRVEKHSVDPWYARSPDGVAILRIDPSLNRWHAITYADGRTGRIDGAPKLGSWELHADGDGRLMIHARGLQKSTLARDYEWVCSQDGSMTTLDFLATVVTYRALLRLRRERLSSPSQMSL